MIFKKKIKRISSSEAGEICKFTDKKLPKLYQFFFENFFMVYIFLIY